MGYKILHFLRSLTETTLLFLSFSLPYNPFMVVSRKEYMEKKALRHKMKITAVHISEEQGGYCLLIVNIVCAKEYLEETGHDIKL